MRKPKDPIPAEFRTLKEAGEFWDVHSAADYWDEMEEVACEVDLQGRRFLVAVEDRVYRAVEREAASQHLSPDVWVNQLLRRELMGT
jgi:predicted HicB family RNase H-like nuclease